MSKESEEKFDYKTICENDINEKCTLCNKSLYPACGPDEYEDDSKENDIVETCANHHRFHRGCVRSKESNYCPFLGCKEKLLKNVDELEAIDYETLYYEFLEKIKQQEGGRKRTRKHKRRSHKKRHSHKKRRTHKRRTYRRK